MAKEILFKIKIADIDTEIAQLGKLQGRIDELSKQQKESSDKTSKAYQANALDLKELKKEYSAKQKYVSDSIKIDKSQGDTVEALRQKLAIVTKQWTQLTAEEIKNSSYGKNLTKQKLELTNALKNVEEASGDTRRNVGNYSDALKGLEVNSIASATGMSGLTNGIQKATSAALKFLATPIGAVLGAVALAVMAVKHAFESSEEGQHLWNKIMQITSGIVGVFSDLIADLGMKIIELFENPKKVLAEFGQAIQNNLVNRFWGMLELIPALGKAIALVFKGEWAEAGKVAYDAAAKATLGIENMTDKIVEQTEKIKKNAAEGLKLANMQNAQDKLQRDLIIKRSKLDSEIEELRLKADKREEYSFEERRGFLMEANRLQDEINEDEQRYLETKLKTIQIENSLSKTKTDGHLKEAEAIADINRKIAERSKAERELQRKLNGINAQIKAEQDAKTKEDEDARKKKLTEETKLQQEIQAIKEKYLMDDKQRMEAEIAEMQARAAFEALAEEEKQIVLKAIRDKYREEETIAIEETLIQRAQKYSGYLDAIQQGLGIVSDFQKMKMDEELANAGDNEEKKDAIRKKYAEKQKKVAIAEAIILGAKGVLQALGSTPPPLSYVLATLTGVAAGVQIAAIKKQTFADGGFTGQGTYRDSTGHKVAGIVHDNEYVVPKTVLQTPMGNSLVSQLEQLRGFADGGFTSTPELPTTIQQMADLRVYVVESDITTTQQRVNVIENNVTF
jgi:hypothetical protein